MIHERERLTFGLEAGEDLAAVHPGLDHLECDLPPHRPLLLGGPHFAHSAFPQLLQQAVVAEHRRVDWRGRLTADRGHLPGRQRRRVRIGHSAVEGREKEDWVIA